VCWSYAVLWHPPGIAAVETAAVRHVQIDDMYGAYMGQPCHKHLFRRYAFILRHLLMHVLWANLLWMCYLFAAVSPRLCQAVLQPFRSQFFRNIALSSNAGGERCTAEGCLVPQRILRQHNVLGNMCSALAMLAVVSGMAVRLVLWYYTYPCPDVTVSAHAMMCTCWFIPNW